MDHERIRSTIVWVVVDKGELFVRSVRGARGRWYRRRWTTRTSPSTTRPPSRTQGDPRPRQDSIHRVTRRSTESTARSARARVMLTPDVLDATLRLEPRFANEGTLEAPAYLGRTSSRSSGRPLKSACSTGGRDRGERPPAAAQVGDLSTDPQLVSDAPRSTARGPPCTSTNSSTSCPISTRRKPRNGSTRSTRSSSEEGENRARFLMYKLLKRARQLHVGLPPLTQTPLHQHDQPGAGAVFPGRRGAGAAHPADRPLERRRDGPAREQRTSRASAATSRHTPRRPTPLRGRASTTSSAARTRRRPATRSSTRATPRPGMYARAFLEGRLDRGPARPLPARGRGQGLSLVPAPAPHARLLGVPDGLDGHRADQRHLPGALQPLPRRTAASPTRRSSRVWAFLGDGEMDEPESIGALSLAAREGLDNLTFVVNCNLQRLDGPVRGNGKIIQELEGLFRGAGWNVIKVIWGREWDELLARDVDGVLVEKMNNDARRRVAEVPRRRRRLHPRALLRARPAAAPARRAPLGRRSRPTAPRRPRLPQGLRRVQGGHRVQRRADRGPREDDQGLDPRRGRRGSQRHPPDQEDVRGGAAGLPRPARAADPRREAQGRARTTTRARLARRCGTSWSAAARSAGRCPRASSATQPLPAPNPEVDARVRGGQRDRASAPRWCSRGCCATCSATRRSARGSCRSSPTRRGRSAWTRCSRRSASTPPSASATSPVDSDLVLSYREAKDGQVLEEGITEAGSMASLPGRRHGVRDARPDDGPVLHLLLDVRLPADRRPDLGLRRRARPRLPDGRHGRPDDAHRRGPPARRRPLATCSRRPSRTSSRTTRRTPTSSRRSSATASSGCTSKRRRRLLLHHALQRELRPAARCPRASRRGSSGASTGSAAAPDLGGEGAVGTARRIRLDPPAGPRGAGAARREARHRRGGLQRPVVPAAAGRGLDGRALEPAAPGRAGARSLRLAGPRTRRRPDRGGHGLDARRARHGRALAAAPFIPLGTDGFGRSDTREALRSFFEIDPPQIAAATLSALVRCGAFPTAQAAKAMRDLGVDPDKVDPRLV